MAGASAESSSYAGDGESRRCRACLSSALRVDWAAGDRVCTNCGLVDEERMLEERADWKEFDDADDIVRNAYSGSAGASRCGLVPTNEHRWVGGLQPTSLSKHIFGGPTPTSSSTRKKLVTANQRLDHLMEKRHTRDLKNAKLSIQIQKRKLAQHSDEEEEDSSVRPEYEQLLVQEEEDALATTAALYADKWSLDRAIRLFGEGYEVEALAVKNEEGNLEGLRKGLDEALTNAARDLYAAYRMMLGTIKTLDLPERVSNEACATLVKYAAQKDGLAVRGVSSQLKSKKNGDKFGKAAASAENQAREALRDFNKMKQIGSLTAAIVFYTARNLNWPRSLVQVCASVETPMGLMGNRHLDVGKDSFIKKKHCSKAMNEIKQILPDLARSAVAPTAGALDNTSTESFVEHITKKLRLPPVAEASVRTLVASEEEKDDKASATSAKTKNRIIMCAAVSYFVCQVGEIMQNLAQQASTSDARPVIIPRKRRKTADDKEINLSKTSKSQLVLGKRNGQSLKNSNAGESFDLFQDEETAREEHRLYEMRRVWDAWREQTAWRRTAAEIEQVCGVSRSSMESFFKSTLYPQRGTLLRMLTGADGAGLGDVPLASVLLPHIAVTEPLLKDSLQ